MKIGLFDSGIGGLTVLKVLKEKYPYNEYIYIMEILLMFLMVINLLRNY